MHTHASSSIKRPLSAYWRLHHLRHNVLWANSLKQTSDNRSVLVSGPVKTNMLIICTYRFDCVCVHWNASTMSESFENDDWNRMSCTYNIVKWSKILESPPPHPPETGHRQRINTNCLFKSSVRWWSLHSQPKNFLNGCLLFCFLLRKNWKQRWLLA